MAWHLLQNCQPVESTHRGGDAVGHDEAEPHHEVGVYGGACSIQGAPAQLRAEPELELVSSGHRRVALAEQVFTAQRFTTAISVRVLGLRKSGEHVHCAVKAERAVGCFVPAKVADWLGAGERVEHFSIAVQNPV